MITHTMTKDELFKELHTEGMWIDSLRDGIAIKYKKRLNPKTATDGRTLLGITTYTTPRKNKVHIAWVRVKTGKFVTIQSIHYYEYTNQNGKRQYINPCYDSFGVRPKLVVVYTAHAMSRLRERAGLSLQDLLYYKADDDGFTVNYAGVYEYKGKKSTMFNFGDKGMFITEKCKWGEIAVTFVNYELLGPVQTEEIKRCMENIKTYNENREREMIESCEDVPRYYRRRVII